MTYNWYNVEYEKNGQLMFVRAFTFSEEDAVRMVMQHKKADVVIAVELA